MLTFPDIDPVFLQIGPISLRWYGLMYILGITGGFWVISFGLKRRLGMTGDDVLNLMSLMVIGVIIGGRLGYILFYNLGYYLQNPLQIFAYWQGGMSYHGGALGCAAAFVGYGLWTKRSCLVLLDHLTLGATVGQLTGRVGNFINGELWGRVTTVPWGMVFPDAGPDPRHPSQLYEAFFEGPVMFLLIWGLLRWGKLRDGVVFAVYLVVYAVIRFVIEFFREPDLHLDLGWGWMTRGQQLSFVMIGLAIVWLVMIYRKPA